MSYPGILGILNQFLISFMNFLPRLGGAIILLIIGWVIGTLFGKIIKKILLRYKIDERIIKKGRIFKVSEIFPLIISWLIYLIFIQIALSEEVLGITILSEITKTIVSFIPSLLEGVVIIIVGYILAEYIKEQVEKSKMIYSEIVANVLFFFVIYVSIALALPLWKIDPYLVNNILLIIIACIGIGLAIAIGFGVKDVVKELAEEYFRKARKKI